MVTGILEFADPGGKGRFITQSFKKCNPFSLQIRKKMMNTSQVHVPGSVFSRILWMYGLYTLLSNAAFLIGYHWLPEGLLRGSPATGGGQIAADARTFWGQYGLTLLFNLGGILVASLVMNIFQVKRISLGYLYPIVLAVFSGLVMGTNSFAASDMAQYNIRDGMALGLSIESLEMLGYLFIIASTVRYGIYQYDSMWQWKPTSKVMKLRDVRLSKPEMLCLVIGILLIIVGAYRETQMAFNLL